MGKNGEDMLQEPHFVLPVMAQQCRYPAPSNETVLQTLH